MSATPTKKENIAASGAIDIMIYMDLWTWRSMGLPNRRMDLQRVSTKPVSLIVTILFVKKLTKSSLPRLEENMWLHCSMTLRRHSHSGQLFCADSQIPQSPNLQIIPRSKPHLICHVLSHSGIQWGTYIHFQLLESLSVKYVAPHGLTKTNSYSITTS